MKLLNHFFYQIVLILYLIKAFPFKNFVSKHKKTSENVIWIFPSFPFGSFRYFGSAAFFQDISLLSALTAELKDFRVFLGPKIGKVRNKNLFYSFTDKFNPSKFESNSRFLSSILKILEQQKCRLYPSLEELKLWEDKEYMYEKFIKYKIPMPKTSILDIHKEKKLLIDEVFNEYSFPFLIKEHFGNHSKGIKYISNRQDFSKYIDVLKSKGISTFAVQEIIKDDSDYRIIVIAKKIEQSYRRVKSDHVEWTTTSTSNGSVVDFSSLPKSIEKEFISFTESLGLTNAAFDASIKDGIIKVYEVSSSYLTNPEPPNKFNKLPYLKFKKNYRIFIKERIKIVFDLRRKWIVEQLKQKIK